MLSRELERLLFCPMHGGHLHVGILVCLGRFEVFHVMFLIRKLRASLKDIRCVRHGTWVRWWWEWVVTWLWAATWESCPAWVRALFEAPRRENSAPRAPPLTRYAAPDGTLLLLTENGTRLMTRAAAASLLRAVLLSPRPPRPRHGEPPHHPLFIFSLYVSLFWPENTLRSFESSAISR